LNFQSLQPILSTPHNNIPKKTKMSPPPPKNCMNIYLKFIHILFSSRLASTICIFEVNYLLMHIYIKITYICKMYYCNLQYSILVSKGFKNGIRVCLFFLSSINGLLKKPRIHLPKKHSDSIFLVKKVAKNQNNASK
jgi:hypothetical protein